MTVLTWGRIDDTLGCAFDLFRLAIITVINTLLAFGWLGDSNETGPPGNRSERIGQLGGPAENA